MPETPDSGSVATNGKNHDIRIEGSKHGICMLIIEEVSLSPCKAWECIPSFMHLGFLGNRIWVFGNAREVDLGTMNYSFSNWSTDLAHCCTH